MSIQKQYAMVLVNSAEFATHQEKYFRMAESQDICVQDGQKMFHITYQPVPEQPILEPDEDFYNAISMEELRASAHEHIRKLYSGK